MGALSGAEMSSRSVINLKLLSLVAGVCLAGAEGALAAWTNPGPSLTMTPVADEPIPFYEVLNSASSSTLHSWLRFSKIDGTLTGLTGEVTGSSNTTYDSPIFSGTSYSSSITSYSTVSVSSVNHTRRVFLLGASVGSPVTLSAQITIPGWFSQTATWLSTAWTTNAIELSVSRDRHIEIPNSIAYGSSNATYVDFKFVVEHSVTFDWVNYRAEFTSFHQDYWNPATNTHNNNFWKNGTVTCNSGHSDMVGGSYYKLEQKVIRVYFSKDKILEARSLDTRLTFGQPDSKGAIPEPDPNEPSQYVDFRSSTYKGGLFIGQCDPELKPRDRSGKCIIQSEVPY